MKEIGPGTPRATFQATSARFALEALPKGKVVERPFRSRYLWVARSMRSASRVLLSLPGDGAITAWPGH